ncbi:ALBINO3-like protein 1, chloroplastic isoform X2 [Salvia miltiorrhiza]|uniref:ALBINO3-like protein 1, chloroplastic isoform X2 n=1 Tax=Salvia miltiorrhiza TaxID=226208 RepID=UPI0025ABE786|nr:ALBINO3-like protein 1, chloroplastic isoform X2 [Salvia miltiorrhiza]
MSSFVHSTAQNLLLSPFLGRTRTLTPVSGRARFSNFTFQKPLLRGGNFGIARCGLGQVPFPDPENAEFLIKDLLGRVEGLLYTVADADVTSPDAVDAVSTTKQNSDWLSGITNAMELVLKVLKDGLSTLHVPYAYGFAIILLTILVKAATFPLTKKQVESAMSMQSLAPQIKAIQERYAGDQERIQLETARLYKLAGINPLAGCLPTLATIPIWIGLYRALSNAADEGLLTEGFFWIPSLSGPTTVAARQTGSGTTWLFPFIDGHPPLGWSDTLAYLVLPVLLVVSQYISVQIMQPPQSNDPNVKSSQAITKLLPLMIGYFALSVPSGLSLYWLTNNILSTGQQVWLRKLGGAKNPKKIIDDIIEKEPTQTLKSISVAPPAKKVLQKEEKLTPEGLRPGERFKQLKEQEARKKRQREEEMRKAEEAAANRPQITNGKVNKEITLLEGQTSSSVNGNDVNSELKDDERSSADREETPDILDDRKNERSNLHMDKNIEKD